MPIFGRFFGAGTGRTTPTELTTAQELADNAIERAIEQRREEEERDRQRAGRERYAAMLENPRMYNFDNFDTFNYEGRPEVLTTPPNNDVVNRRVEITELFVHDHMYRERVMLRAQQLMVEYEGMLDNVVTHREVNVFLDPYRTQHMCHVRFTITTKEEEPMPEIPKQYTRLIKDPPEAIAVRNIEKLHLFNELMKQLRNQDGEITENNDRRRLASNNFASHPSVHRGYYDSKRGGVIYVKDNLTGESIRKDQAILLCTGVFISENSPTIINLGRTQDKDKVTRAVDGNREYITWCEGKFLKVKGLPIFVPLDLTIMCRVIHTTQLNQALTELFQQFLGGVWHTPFDIDGGDNMTQEMYDAFVVHINEHGQHHPIIQQNSTLVATSHKEGVDPNLLLIPDDADFFQGWRIVSEGQRNFNTRVTEGMTRRASETRPVLVINGGNTGIRIPDPHAPVGELERRCRRLNDTGVVTNFPVELALRVHGAKVAAVERNRTTRNNEGLLLNYTAKVNDFKISFLMTEEEQRQQTRIKQELMEKVAKIAKKRQDLSIQRRKTTEKRENDALRNQIHSLKTPKTPAFDKPIFMGWELEVVPKASERTTQGMQNIVRDIADSGFGNHAIIKSDSSIGDYGFEVVSIPATLKYHKDMLEKNFFALPNSFHKRMMSTERCGIHVHISKEAFTKLSLGKFIAFINSPINQAFVNEMAGRGVNKFCQRMPLKNMNSKGVDQSAALAKKINMTKKNPSMPRGAVNLQTTEHTVEIRIFKSTNMKNNFLRKLEFCESLVRFCRGGSLQQMTVYDYVNFLMRKENRKEYPHLVRWLAAKNYIEHETAKIKGKNKLVHVYGKNKIPKPDNIYHRNNKQT